MIELKKPVSRTTYAEHQGRRLQVILEPPNLITIKEKGRRKGYTLTVEKIFMLAAWNETENQRKLKRQKRKKGD